MQYSKVCVVLAGLLLQSVAPCQLVTHGEFTIRGTGCMRGDNSLFELFDAAAFDLDGSSTIWSIASHGGYQVASGGSFLPHGTGVNIAVGSQQVIGPWPLGFAFPLAGGTSSTAVDLSPAGYVYMDPGTNTDGRCCDGENAVPDFLAASPSFAVFGANLNAGPTGAGQIWFDTDLVAGRQVAYFTWDQVADGTDVTATNTLQIQFWDDATCVLAWNGVANPTRTALVGWSGGGIPGYGELDLSGLPIAGVSPQTLEPPLFEPNSGFPPMYPGQFSFRIRRPTVLASALLLGFSQVELPLDSIGLPRCRLYTLGELGAVPGVVGGGVVCWSLQSFVPNVPANHGIEFEMQALIVGAGANALNLELSAAASVRIGSFPFPLSITPGVHVLAEGVSVQPDPFGGFWKVQHRDPGRPRIRRVTFDFSVATRGIARSQSFSTLDSFVNFDGGNSALPGCAGTYRGSDVTVGLDYTNSDVSSCDPSARTGWMASQPHLPGLFPGFYRKLTFEFTHFDSGEEFEFDCATMGENPTGFGMDGAWVTIEFEGGAVAHGELVALTDMSLQVF